jgi:hypothetical protein
MRYRLICSSNGDCQVITVLVDTAQFGIGYEGKPVRGTTIIARDLAIQVRHGPHTSSRYWPAHLE